MEGTPLVEELHLMVPGILAHGIPQLGGGLSLFSVSLEFNVRREDVRGWYLGVAFYLVMDEEVAVSYFILGSVALISVFHFDLRNSGEQERGGESGAFGNTIFSCRI